MDDFGYQPRGRGQAAPSDKTYGSTEKKKATTVELATFVDTYKPAKSKVEEMTGYPENDISKSPLYVECYRQWVAGSCVYELAANHVETAFRIQVKPSRKVEAKQAFKKSASVLVPATNVINHFADGATRAIDAFACTLEDGDGTSHEFVLKQLGAFGFDRE